MKNYFYISDINVSDAVSTGNSMGFVDGNTNPALDDYEYDFRVKDFEKVFCEETERSSMVKDKNKGITSIAYNHLNLPVEIIWSGTKKIEYLYNAAGVKVRKKVNDGTNITITDYLDGFQYNEQVLEFFPTTEGYVKATPTGLVPPGTPPSTYAFNYVFNYTDHLGNVRLSYAKDPQTGNLKILDESHYYPFGLKHQEYVNFGFVNNPIQGVIIAPLTNNPYKYKYNGKEWQDELNFNMYDMDMRQYDPAIARWVVLDPVIHHSMSLYNAFDNNPVFWADPSGADVEASSIMSDIIPNEFDNWAIQDYMERKMSGELGFFNCCPGKRNDYLSPEQDGSPENPIILEPAMLRPPNSFTAVALRAYANSYNGPQFSPPNFFFFKRTNETLYNFNNGLINDTDGFGSDFYRPGDKVRSVEMIPIGADAVGTAGFDFLNDFGILKKKQNIFERNMDMVIFDRDSFNNMSYKEYQILGRPERIEEIKFKGTSSEFYKLLEINMKHGDTVIWERGYPFK